MPAYRFLEGLVTADLAFEATGKDLNQLFKNAALAMFSAQAKLSSITPKITKRIRLEHEDLEQLLFDFLNDIIYFKDAKQLLFKTAKVKITKDKNYKLDAELKGETLNLKKHKLGNDLKAVTYHQFRVEKTKSGWKCVVVVDI